MRRLLVTAAVCAVLLGTAVPAQAENAPPAPSDSTPAEPNDPAMPTGAPPSDAPPSDAPPSGGTDLPATPPAVTASRIPLRQGAVGWRVAKVQERLAWLGYDIGAGNVDNERMGASTVSAVRKFQLKFGLRPNGVVGQTAWDRLAEIAGRVGRLPTSCLGEMTICIDKTQRLMRLVKKGKVLITLDARFGFPGAETNEGTFRVHLKSRDHTSSLYRTWMPFALFFSGGQAVHYSPYFARDGYYGASHGCVNLRDYKGARWLFDQVPLGTRVHVYRS